MFARKIFRSPGDLDRRRGGAAARRDHRRGPVAPNLRRSVPFSDFLRDVDRGAVTAIAVHGDTLEVTRTGGQVVRTTAPDTYMTANPILISELAKHGVLIEVRGSADALASSATARLLLGLALLGAAGFAVYRTLSGRIPALESKTREMDSSMATITFADVAGVDEAKEEVKEIVDFLREPGLFSAIGGRIPKGVLLVGPPGTGKTLLARSIAGEAHVPFFFSSGSDFVEMYAGVGASRIRRLFKDARRHQSCIVFIDELDAVGRSRGGASLSHEEREQTLNQLLVEMDGFAQNRGSSSLPRPTVLTFSIRHCSDPAASTGRSPSARRTSRDANRSSGFTRRTSRSATTSICGRLRAARRASRAPTWPIWSTRRRCWRCGSAGRS